MYSRVRGLFTTDVKTSDAWEISERRSNQFIAIRLENRNKEEGAKAEAPKEEAAKAQAPNEDVPDAEEPKAEALKEEAAEILARRPWPVVSGLGS